MNNLEIDDKKKMISFINTLMTLRNELMTS